VAFGGEGGIRIVAENVRQLIHLLTYDVKVSVYMDMYSAWFCRLCGYDESLNRPEFLKWAKDTYGLKPIEETERIISAAEKKF
jgi:hypothetical protein